MAAPTRPTRKTAAAATTNGDGETAAPAEKPKRTRNVRPIMPLFYEDVDEGTMTELGAFKGNTAEEAFQTYLDALDEEDREAAWAAANYVVFTPDEGMVRLGVIPPTEPTVARR